MSWNGSPFSELRYISAKSSGFGQVLLQHVYYLGPQHLLSQENLWSNVIFCMLVLFHLRPVALWLVAQRTQEVKNTLEGMQLKLAIVEERVSKIEKDMNRILYSGV